MFTPCCRMPFNYALPILSSSSFFFFFFNDTATTEIYTLSLHDALPISRQFVEIHIFGEWHTARMNGERSEEHTSELQSQSNLVCRLLLEKKKKKNKRLTSTDI